MWYKLIIIYLFPYCYVTFFKLPIYIFFYNSFNSVRSANLIVNLKFFNFTSLKRILKKIFYLNKLVHFTNVNRKHNINLPRTVWMIIFLKTKAHNYTFLYIRVRIFRKLFYKVRNLFKYTFNFVYKSRQLALWRSCVYCFWILTSYFSLQKQ